MKETGKAQSESTEFDIAKDDSTTLAKPCDTPAQTPPPVEKEIAQDKTINDLTQSDNEKMLQSPH